MSTPDPASPEDRLRLIEEETDRLADHIEEAKTAVHKAMAADSMASPGDSDLSRGAVGGDAEDDRPQEVEDPKDAEDPEDSEQPGGDDTH